MSLFSKADIAGIHSNNVRSMTESTENKLHYAPCIPHVNADLLSVLIPPSRTNSSGKSLYMDGSHRPLDKRER